jgi:hypothetical protein
LGKERKFVWVVTTSFSHLVIEEQQVWNMGEESGIWNNKYGKILEHVVVFLETFGV